MKTLLKNIKTYSIGNSMIDYEYAKNWDGKLPGIVSDSTILTPTDIFN